jgi:hypothetical protein
MLLEELVPEYDFGEVHSTRLSAPPEDALGAVTLVELDEMPLVRLLFAVRSIPAYVAGKGGPAIRCYGTPLRADAGIRFRDFS